MYATGKLKVQTIRKSLHICWFFYGKNESWSPTDLPAIFTPWNLGQLINSNIEVLVCAMTVTLLVKRSRALISTALVYPLTAKDKQLTVTFQDSNTAKGNSWLNDVVVGFLLCKIRETLLLQGVPDGHCHIFTSYFFTKLTMVCACPAFAAREFMCLGVFL